MDRLRRWSCMLYGIRKRPVLYIFHVEQMYHSLRELLDNRRALSEVPDHDNEKGAGLLCKGRVKNRIIQKAVR